jgi:hypothetical protein
MRHVRRLIEIEAHSHAAERALARSSVQADEEAFAQRCGPHQSGSGCEPAGIGIECVYRAAWGAGSGLVIADRMAFGCRESALSVGQVGDYREVIGWPHAVYRCIAA